MSVYKDKERGTWYTKFRYKDWKDETKWITKRGFSTKREAVEWETKFKQRQAATLDMTFADFTKVYETDIRLRLKQNTWLTKEHVIRTKLIPYFGKKKMNEIKPSDVIQWQNEMMSAKDHNGKPYSETYLKTLHNQLSAIFNHAIRFYELSSNPANKAGNMGKEKSKEMLFWIKEEYLKFAEATKKDDVRYFLCI